MLLVHVQGSQITYNASGSFLTAGLRTMTTVVYTCLYAQLCSLQVHQNLLLLCHLLKLRRYYYIYFVHKLCMQIIDMHRCLFFFLWREIMMFDTVPGPSQFFSRCLCNSQWLGKAPGVFGDLRSEGNGQCGDLQHHVDGLSLGGSRRLRGKKRRLWGCERVEVRRALAGLWLLSSFNEEGGRKMCISDVNFGDVGRIMFISGLAGVTKLITVLV